MFARGPQLGLRLILLTILSIVLMVLDHREHYLAPVRIGLNVLIAPIQYVVDSPIKLVSAFSSNFSTREVLIAENASLRAQQLLLQAKLQRLIALESENSELRTLLKSSPKVQNDRVAVAQLLSVSTDPLTSELVIDKGLRSQVYEGQPVVDGTGIVGQVMQVGAFTSRVLLITDLRSAVPVQVTRNGIRGLLIGRGNLAKLTLTDIPETVDVKVGDILVSSGLGGHFPEGYPVGTVSLVLHNSGGQFTKIEVIPSAQLDRRRNVLLIWLPHQQQEISKIRPANTLAKLSGVK